jgi:hypothetical protein
MNKSHRETLDFVLNEIEALELVLGNLKEGITLERMRMDAKEGTTK